MRPAKERLQGCNAEKAIFKGVMMQASKRQAGFAALSIVVLLMTACGGGGGGSTIAGTSTVLSAYVANYGDGTISQYTINPSTGALTPKVPATVVSMSSNASSYPTSIIVDQAGKHAYVANNGDYVISQFNIGPGGVLVPMTPAATVQSGSGPISIAIHPSGKYAYAANSYSNDISQFIVDPATGALTPMGTPTVTPCSPSAPPCAKGIWPISITVDPSGAHVYVVNQNDNSVSQFIVDPATGALTPMGTATVAAGTTPSSITIDPSGNFAYVTNYLATPNASITQFSITSGALTSSTSPGLGSALTLPTSMAIDPSGTHAYVANGTGIYPFTINGSGLIDNMIPNNSTGGTSQQSVAIDSSGKFVYVANKGSDNISQFNIGAGGSLSAPTVTQGATGSQPYSITTAVLKL